MKKEQSSAVNEYFSYLARTVSPDTPLGRAAEQYLAEERAALASADPAAPFLSVVTRTQGKRPEALKEMLASLEVQTDGDFELLLMGHNLSEEQNEVVSKILSELPPSLAARTRFIPVVGGTRTTPLNRGFEAALGRYIAVLDDDDLVYPHWVAAFRELAATESGKILHAFSDVQEWRMTKEGKPVAAGPKGTHFHCKFNLLNQLSINSCPLCALAFPAYAFKTLGIRFDESLTTTEDWDYLMRTAILTGVADTSEVTFLYRKWLDAENSYTLHKKEEWDRNYQYIVQRFLSTPILFPAGSLHGIIDKGLGQVPVQTMREMELFFENRDGFSPFRQWKPADGCDREGFSVLFEPKAPTPVRALRLDPRYDGHFVLSSLRLLLVTEEGEEREFGLSDMTSNGYSFDERTVFLFDDPQLLLILPEPVMLKRVYVACELNERIEEGLLTAAMNAYAASRRPIRRLLRATKKFLRRIYIKLFKK